MHTKTRLQQLEQEATFEERIVKALDTNPEYLQLSMKSFLKKYNMLMVGDKFKAYERLKELLNDPNFKLMYAFYGYYFDKDGKEIGVSSDFQLKSLHGLKKYFMMILKV